MVRIEYHLSDARDHLSEAKKLFNEGKLPCAEKRRLKDSIKNCESFEGFFYRYLEDANIFTEYKKFNIMNIPKTN